MKRTEWIRPFLITVLLFILPTTPAQAKPLTRIAVFNDSAIQNESSSRIITSLVEGLNRYRWERIEARQMAGKFLEYQATSNYKNCTESKSAEDKRTDSDCFEYYLVVSAETKEGLIESNTDIYTKSGKELVKNQLKVNDEEKNKDAADKISREIIDKLSTIFFRNIRIAALDFSMRGGDQGKYSQLKRLLPNMLAKGLHLSSRLVLVDIFDSEELKSYMERTDKHSSVYDRNTLIDKGKLLHANYLITGEFGELSDELWLSTQCNSVETGEIIASLYATIAPITLDELEKKMAVIAAEMKERIESDHELRELRPKYVAMSGAPPIPDTRENRETLLAIIDAVGLKLDALPLNNIRIKKDLNRVTEFIEKEHDTWVMNRRLKSDYILLVTLDRRDRDLLKIDINRYDMADPNDEDRYHVVASPTEVDEKLNEKLSEIVERNQWLRAEADVAGLRTVEFSGPYKQYGFKVLGGISYRNSQDLFLDSAGGIALDIGYVVYPFSSSRWQLEIPRLTLDFLGSSGGGSQKVVGANLSGSLIYNLRPLNANNIYVGGSLSILGVFRDGSDDRNYDGRLGAGAILGWERTFLSSRKLNIRLEYLRAFDDIDAWTVSGDTFGGGRPGGFYVLVGTEFSR